MCAGAVVPFVWGWLCYLLLSRIWPDRPAVAPPHGEQVHPGDILDYQI